MGDIVDDEAAVAVRDEDLIGHGIHDAAEKVVLLGKSLLGPAADRDIAKDEQAGKARMTEERIVAMSTTAKEELLMAVWRETRVLSRSISMARKSPRMARIALVTEASWPSESIIAAPSRPCSWRVAIAALRIATLLESRERSFWT